MTDFDWLVFIFGSVLAALVLARWFWNWILNL